MEEINAARDKIGVWEPAPVEVVAPDPSWAKSYLAARKRICAALGQRALRVEHVGSTAVPGLWAKQVIDIDLTVADSADEGAWLPDLEAAGFVLRVREPDWEEHRLVRGQAPTSNVHVFSAGAREPRRHLLFRDWLRTHPDDRDRYSAVKREVAARGFTDSMLYNNAKAGFVYDLYEKVFANDPESGHDPHPRPHAADPLNGEADRAAARVIFMCGPSGSGKTTHAKQLEDQGMVRLSFDIVMWQRGISTVPLPQVIRDEIEAELRARLLDLVREGSDVVLDFSFWSRQMRADYRQLLAPTGVVPETIYLATDRATVLERVRARRGNHADDFELTEELAAHYFDHFEPPTTDEGPLEIVG